MMDKLIFVALAGLLVVVSLAGLLFPLLRRGSGPRLGQHDRHAPGLRRQLNAAIYRDQLLEIEHDRESGDLAVTDYEQARDELQRRLLQETRDESVENPLPSAPAITHSPARRTSWVLVLFLPLSAVLLYLWLGNPAALHPVEKPARITAEQIDGMVLKLAERLQQNPDDLKGWMMLARSYEALQRFDDAAAAFEHIMRLGGDKNPDLLVRYADLLGVLAGGKLEGRPLELVEQALKLDPSHLTALALAGSAAYTREDYAATLDYWGRLEKILPKDAEEAAQLSAKLDEIRALHTSPKDLKPMQEPGHNEAKK